MIVSITLSVALNESGFIVVRFLVVVQCASVVG